MSFLYSPTITGSAYLMKLTLNIYDDEGKALELLYLLL